MDRDEDAPCDEYEDYGDLDGGCYCGFSEEEHHQQEKGSKT